MANNRSACLISTWTAADATIVSTAGYFYGVIALGSDAASTVTLLDGTAIKFSLPFGTTAGANVILSTPVAFSTSIIADLTGTGSYSVLYSKVLT